MRTYFFTAVLTPAVVASVLFGVTLSSQAQNQPAQIPSPNRAPAATPTPTPTTAAVSANPNAGKPSIKFASLIWDFGRVSSGEKVRHDFIFTNVGTANLEITQVKPGCGCTTAGQWDRTVAPGKTGKIPIEFNTGKYSAKVTKTTYVTSNDPEQPRISLQITGNPWKPIVVTPSMLTFFVAPGTESNVTKTVRIVSNLEEPITLSDAKVANTNFAVKLRTTKAGKEFALDITAVPPFSKRNSYGSITAKTSSAQVPEIKATAYVVVQEPILISPQRIALSAEPLPSAQTKTVRVRRMDPGALILSEPKVNVPGVNVTVKGNGLQGRFYNVVAVFPKGFRVPLGKQVEITIETDHPKHPLIKIPVTQSSARVGPRAATSAPVRVPPLGPAPGTTLSPSGPTARTTPSKTVTPAVPAAPLAPPK